MQERDKVIVDKINYKISIITPTYNSEKYIKDTLDSIASQTYKNIEHIICDNLSTDKTKDICSIYENNFYSKKDKSMYNAINNGINLCTGDILCFLNSDDTFFNTKTLENVSNFFSKNPTADVLYGKSMRVDKNLKYLYTHSPLKIINFNSASKRLFFASHPSIFLRRSVFSKFGLYDTSIKCMADCEYWLRLMKNNVKFYYYPEILSIFRLHDSNLSKSGCAFSDPYLIINKYNIQYPFWLMKLFLLFDNIKNFDYLFYLLKRTMRSVLLKLNKSII